MDDQPPTFSLPAVVTRKKNSTIKKKRATWKHFEKFEDEMDGGKYGESATNRLLTASPTMRLSRASWRD